MLDCMHKFRARSHKISTPCKISTPSSRYGFSHDLHVFFFDVHVENTGMTLAFRLAWSVLCCGHENRVRTRVTRGSGQPKKKSRGGIFWCARARESRIFFGLTLAQDRMRTLWFQSMCHWMMTDTLPSLHRQLSQNYFDCSQHLGRKIQ